MPQREPGIGTSPSPAWASRVMQVTFGRSGSWLSDHTAAENITSSKAGVEAAAHAGVGIGMISSQLIFTRS